MHQPTRSRVHQYLHAREQALPNPFEPQLVADSGSICLPESGHPTCNSILDLELHYGDISGFSGSSGSGSGHLDTKDSVVSHDGISEGTAATGVMTLDGRDNVHGSMCSDPTFNCNKQGQDLPVFLPQKALCDGKADTASKILCNGEPFTDSNDADAVSGFTGASTDKDPLDIEHERSVGPGRHYDLVIANGGEMQGPSVERPSSTQTNEDSVSNVVFTPWGSPEESIPNAREVIQRAEKPRLIRNLIDRRNPQESNTLLHCTRSGLASGPFFATLGQLTAVIGIFLTVMHEGGLVTIGILMAAVYEAIFAATGVSVAALDEESAPHFNTRGDKSPPTEPDWRVSPFSSSATRQTRINQWPKGKIQRLTPRDGIIYFGIDLDSFERLNIDPDFTTCMRKAVLEAAEDFRKQNLGIAFAYTEDPGLMVFTLRHDPGLHPETLAEAFFPSDSPNTWHLRVGSLANNRNVFEENRDFMRNILDHEFAHILGLRHYDAGLDDKELEEPSVLFPGTVDAGWDTVMRKGVGPCELELSEEDVRVIREFYSMKNGEEVDGAIIVNVDPYKRLLEFFYPNIHAAVERGGHIIDADLPQRLWYFLVLWFNLLKILNRSRGKETQD